jgi:hypothetical protein
MLADDDLLRPEALSTTDGLEAVTVDLQLLSESASG